MGLFGSKEPKPVVLCENCSQPRDAHGRIYTAMMFVYICPTFLWKLATPATE